MQEIIKNIDWEFSDKKVTPWGGMRMFKEFLDQSEKIFKEIPSTCWQVGYPNPFKVI